MGSAILTGIVQISIIFWFAKRERWVLLISTKSSSPHLLSQKMSYLKENDLEKLLQFAPGTWSTQPGRAGICIGHWSSQRPLLSDIYLRPRLSTVTSPECGDWTR